MFIIACFRKLKIGYLFEGGGRDLFEDGAYLIILCIELRGLLIGVLW